MNIVTESPIWFVLFCFAIGLTYAGVLYYQNRKLNDFPSWLIRTLAIVRFICISLLSFLLLSPVLEVVNRKLEKPLIVIAQDNSESILMAKDAGYYQKDYLNQLQKLREGLNDKYETVVYNFADGVQPISTIDSIRFSEKQTNLSALFDELETRYSNRNVGAILMASDGLYNKGSHPLYASEKIKVPIYTIAMGDTTIKKDIALLKVEQNRIAYLGNEFPLHVVVDAKRLKGKSTTLTIQQGTEILFSQAITFTAEHFITTIPIILEAREKGLQKYKLKLSSLPEEVSTLNNTKEVYIDVLDARQKVLILAHAPHPDIAAIKESIERNQNYEVEVALAANFSGAVNKYNLIILHQVPHPTNPYTTLLNGIRERAIPVWVFSGANSIPNNNLTQLRTTSQTNTCEMVLNKDFSLFTISKAFQDAVKNFPPVTCPFGDYSVGAGSNALFYQRIGMVETKNPIMAFGNNNESKYAVFYGEGIWKWRLHDYLANENHEVFDEFISKTVQYLSLNEDKSFFKVNAPKSFLENEPILMEAEVYNQSYELINDPEVALRITNSEKKQFPFTFSKTNNAYRLDAGRMPVGDYQFEASVQVGDKAYKQKGVFSILELQLEAVNTVAEHQLLYAIAQQHDGELIYPDQLGELLKMLSSREDIKTLAYMDKKMSDLINYKWIFFLLLFLLSLEWFIRKRNGAY